MYSERMSEGSNGSKDTQAVPYIDYQGDISRRQFLRGIARVGIGAAATASVAGLAVEEAKVGFLGRIFGGITSAIGEGFDNVFQRPSPEQRQAAKLLAETPDSLKNYYRVRDHKEIRQIGYLNTRKEPIIRPSEPGVGLIGKLQINDPVPGAVDWPGRVNPQTGKTEESGWVVFMQDGKPVFVAKDYLQIDPDNQPAKPRVAHTNDYWNNPITNANPVNPQKPK